MNPADAIEQLKQANERVRQQAAELATQRKKRVTQAAANQAEILDQRRKGEHGRDWQVLQQRIDLGQTTEFDVVQGLDLSNEARAVRKQMGETLGKVADERAKEGEGPAPMTPELAEAQQGLIATLQRLNEMSASIRR